MRRWLLVLLLLLPWPALAHAQVTNITGSLVQTRNLHDSWVHAQFTVTSATPEGDFEDARFCVETAMGELMSYISASDLNSPSGTYINGSMATILDDRDNGKIKYKGYYSPAFLDDSVCPASNILVTWDQYEGRDSGLDPKVGSTGNWLCSCALNGQQRITTCTVRFP